MSKIIGLNSAEVKERFKNKQYNRATRTKTKTIGQILVENILSVFNFIIGLIIIFFVFFYLRSFDSRLLLDSIGIFMVAFTNTSIAIYQEIKAKKVLDRVELLLKKTVTVIRNGQQISIPHQKIVLDDVIFLQRGDQAVVDGRILQANHLEIDESLLTGESVPITKVAGEHILSGSFCLSGHGYYVAERVGDDSYASEVTRLAKKYKFTLTPLQRRINFFVKALFGAAIVLILLKILLTWNISLLEIDAVRKIGTILESLVPQGLVLMSSVAFAIGVHRISKVGAIVQKLNAVESFSNVQVTCMDKTGTLTENKLSVQHVLPLSAGTPEKELKTLLGTYARLSSDKNATIRALESFNPDGEASAVDELPFNSARKMSLLKIKNGDSMATFVLGAYDILIERLSPHLKAQAAQIFAARHLEVYRNLLFARAVDGFSLEEVAVADSQVPLEPLGIVAIADRIREDVMEAISLFGQKGIELKILSGDAPQTIQAVCREIGWEVEAGDIISGKELDDLSREQFTEVVQRKMVFGRLKPEHKLRIIKELRARKIYTAMIGDGVNDLPAIKEADLGIAMEEGSTVTKEVADIILLKNKFALLPKIFEEGNKVINTVGAVAKLFLTKNFLIVYLGLMSIIFFLEFPLTPRRVSLMNIFAIGLPSMIIAFLNRNVQPYKNFMLDLFSFVGIAALVIMGSGYLSFYLSESIPHITHFQSEKVMIAVMTVVSVANYFAVTIHKDEKRKMQYLIYGLLMLCAYFLLLYMHGHNDIINTIKMFYEIPNLPVQAWWLIFQAGLCGSLLLLILEKIRGWLIKTNS
jgi:cation-transporting P-type ATPase E